MRLSTARLVFSLKSLAGRTTKAPRCEPTRTRAEIQTLESRLLLNAAITSALPAYPSASRASIALNNTTWTPIGPSPTTGSGVVGGGGISGRLNAVAADPTNANVIYVTAAAGGVWKTTDGGNSWASLTDSQTTLNMGAIAVAASSPNTIYAATGDSTGSQQSFYGQGVLKSTDGGATWALEGNTQFTRRVISQVAVDPTNPSNVYVAVAQSGINGVGGNPSAGVYNSTDGGSTWVNKTASLSTVDQYSDVGIDPSNPQHIFISRTNGFTAEGVYVTNDGGTTWTLVGGGLPNRPGIGNTKIAISPSNPQVVYTSFLTADSRLLGIWKSTDGGTTWSQLPNVPDYAAGTGYYADSLIVDPHDSNIVYAGGAQGLVQSTDGGQTWADITVGAGGTSGTFKDHHGEAFDASGHLLDATDGGIFRLDNATPGAIAWSDLNTNLQTATFLSGAIDPTNPDKLFASGQDDGTMQFSGSATWSQSDTVGDAGYVLVDAQNPLRIYRDVPLTAATTGSFIRRSDDGGATWTSIVSGIDPTEATSLYPGFAIDPSNGNHIVFGTDRIYESYDGGNTWNPISTPLTNGWTVDNTVTVAKIAISATDPHIIYASDAGHIFVTTNDGATWTQTDPNNSQFGSITVDPTNSKIAYTTASVFGSNKVMRTIDGGATWQNISGNLPNLPTYPLVVAGSTLYVGNDNGVYVSVNDGGSWSHLGAGLPNVQVRDLKYDSANNLLAAFTYGRGVWEISTAPSPAPLVVNTLLDDATPGDGLLSLRQAITTANSTGQSIGFDPSLGGGTITLDPANGSLSISKGFSITAPTTGAITVDTGALPIQVLGGFIATLSNISLKGTATVLQDTTAQIVINNANITGDITDNGYLNFYQFVDGSVTGNISGTSSISKNGPGTLTLNGTNTYSNGTTIQSGILYGNTQSLQGGMTEQAGAYVAFDESSLSNSSGTFSGFINGAGNIHLVAGTLNMGSRSNSTPSTFTNAGQVRIDSGATLVGAAANNFGTAAYIINGSLNLGGFNQIIGLLSGSGNIYNLSTQSNPLATLSIGTGGSSTFTGVLENVPAGSGGAGILSIAKLGGGKISLASTAAYTYSGGTYLDVGTLAGNTQTIQGGIVLNGGSLTIDQSLGQLGSGTLIGTISGTGNVTINGIVQLGASTVTTAPTLIVNGTLVAGEPDQITNLIVNGAFDLGGHDQAVATLSGSGVIYNDEPTLQGTAVLSLGSTIGAFAGTLEDHSPSPNDFSALALNVQSTQGGNTVTLVGQNTYSGGTTFSANAVIIGPSAGNPLGTGPLTFAGGNISLRGRTTPVQQVVPFTGFNQDVIADASSTNPLATTTSSFDASNGGGDFVWYEQGFGGAAGQGTGLPAGTTFSSLVNPSVSFQLQPANANNVLFVPQQGSGSITVPLVTPGSFASLNLLAASADGGSTLTAQLNFADGSTTSFLLNVPDWFNGTGAAVVAGGRIVREAGASISLRPGNPRLYELDMALGANSLKTVNSITFTQSGSSTGTNTGIVSRIGIFALSGARLSLAATQTYGNAVIVNANAPIDIQNSMSATLGSLIIDNNATLSTTGSSSLSGGSALPLLTFGDVTLQSSASFSAGPLNTISLGLITDNGLGFGINLVNNSGTVELRGNDSFSSNDGFSGITNDASGTLLVDSAGGLPGGPLIIGQLGYTKLAMTAAPFTANVSSLSIAPQGGALELTDNSLLIHYSPGQDPITTIQSYVNNGYGSGSWNQPTSSSNGYITSLSAENNPTMDTVGYADSADLGNPAGLAPNTVEVSYTVIGDSNLNGTVDINDYNAVVRQFGTGTTWDQGLVTYDGTVSISDYDAVIRHFGQTATAPGPASTAKLVTTTAASVQSASTSSAASLPMLSTALLTPANAGSTDNAGPKKTTFSTKLKPTIAAISVKSAKKKNVR